jgi:hypothetical protein
MSDRKLRVQAFALGLIVVGMAVLALVMNAPESQVTAVIGLLLMAGGMLSAIFAG